MSKTMRVIEIKQPGGPEALVLGRRPVPAPGEGEILIEVNAAGVNRPDILQRLGLYPPPPGASDIPGLEVAGTVKALGQGVDSLRVGDRVCALVAGGGYAEFATAPAPQCLPVPGALTMEEAAALPETFFTVWTNVFERGRLSAGETLLVHGGSSGIGTTAIQMARARGATVFTTAGSDEKCRACEALGAELAVNYRREDFVAVLKKKTAGAGVDVILDMVSGEYVERNIELAAVDGRVVIIAFLRGSRAEIDLRPLMVKRLTLTGSTLRPRTVEEKGLIASALKREIWPLIEAGEIKPQIFETFTLAEASKAHALMESSRHIGKIVLKMNPDVEGAQQ